MNKYVLRVESISKNYGSIKALINISFNVKENEYLCILGPTGAGKTTLLKIIAGLLRPDKGKVMLKGENITYLPPERRSIGYMPQGYVLFPHMNVWDNVSYGAIIRSVSKKRAEEALKIVGLFDRKFSYPNELSGGQKQRIALARALTSNAKLLLLDEPLAALDLPLNIRLRNELRRIVKSLKLTAIHVTHNIEEAFSIADRIIIINKGRIEQVGSPYEIYMHPKNLFIANFLSEINVMEGMLKGIYYNRAVISIERLGDIEVITQPVNYWHVVVVYRPEDILIYKSLPEDKRNLFKGVVTKKIFLGSYTRIYLSVNSLTLLSDTYLMDLKVGDRVYLRLPLDSGIIYPYPREGLMKALEIEYA